MGLISKNIESKGALRADSALFRTIMNRDVMATERHTNAAASAADRNAWASTLNEMARNRKQADFSEDQSRKSFVRTDFPFITLNRKELRSLIQIDVESAV